MFNSPVAGIYRNKSEVDKYVQKKLKGTDNETLRSSYDYQFAKLYFQVRDYPIAEQYVNKYLSLHRDSEPAYKLQGQIYQAMGLKDKSINSYRYALLCKPNIGRSQELDIVNKVCDIIINDTDSIDVTKVQFWLSRLEALNPTHSHVAILKDRIVRVQNKDTAQMEIFYKSRVGSNQKDVDLQVQLISFYTTERKLNEALDHITQTENMNLFAQNVDWYACISKAIGVILDGNVKKDDAYLLQLHSLDMYVSLLTNGIPSACSALTDMASSLHNLDQAMFIAASDAKLPASYLQHMKGQFCLHMAVLLMKKARKERTKFKDAIGQSAPLLLTAWNSTDKIVLPHAPSEIQKKVTEYSRRNAAMRLCHSGYALIGMVAESRMAFAERINRLCATASWKERLYHRMFATPMPKTSYFMQIIQFYPIDHLEVPASLAALNQSQQVMCQIWPQSLHHLVWLNLQLTNQIILTPFETIRPDTNKILDDKPETLSLMDLEAFMSAVILTAQENTNKSGSTLFSPLPRYMPPAVSDVLCTEKQRLFWSAAHTICFGGTWDEYTRRLLQVGLGVVRALGNHGVSVRLLVHWAKLFAEKLNHEDVLNNEAIRNRAIHYWEIAVKLCEKTLNKIPIPRPKDCFFTIYTESIPTDKVLDQWIEEGKIFLGCQLIEDGRYEEGSIMMKPLVSPYASFYMSNMFQRMAMDVLSETDISNASEEQRTQYVALLSKSRDCLYLTLDRLRSPMVSHNHPLNEQLSNQMKYVEDSLSMAEQHLSTTNTNGVNVSSDPLSINDERTLDHTLNRSMPDPNIFSVNLLQQRHVTNAQINSLYNTPRTPERAGGLSPIQLSVSRAEARPSPERLDAQLKAMMYSQDTLMKALFEQNKALLEANKVIVEELRQNKTTMCDLKNQVDNLSQSFVMMQTTFDHPARQYKPGDVQGQDLEEGDYMFEDKSYRQYSGLRGSSTVLYGGPGGIYLPPSEQLDVSHGPYYSALPFSDGQQLPDFQQFAYSTPVSANTRQQSNLQTTPVTNINKSNTPHEFQISLPPEAQILTKSPLEKAPNAPPITLSILSNIPDPVYSAVGRPTKISESLDDGSNLEEDNDPIPDFKPVVPLPAEVEIHTGEEEETVLFEEKVKLFRFVNKEWKERGIGPLKILHNTENGKVRLLVRREQVLKVCANHFIIPTMNLKAMPSSADRAWLWTANDFSDEELKVEQFCGRFKTAEEATKFKEAFEKAKGIATTSLKVAIGSTLPNITSNVPKSILMTTVPSSNTTTNTVGGFVFVNQPTIKPIVEVTPKKEVLTPVKPTEPINKPFSTFTFTPMKKSTPDIKTSDTFTASKFSQISFTSLTPEDSAFKKDPNFSGFQGAGTTLFKGSTISQGFQGDNSTEEAGAETEFEPKIDFEPVIPLPALVDVKTGEEGWDKLFSERAKLFRFVTETKEWKERGIGEMKILREPKTGKSRLLMRREQVHKVCCSHLLTKDIRFEPLMTSDRAWTWIANDYSEGEYKMEKFAIKFKTSEKAKEFKAALEEAVIEVDKSFDDNEDETTDESETESDFNQNDVDDENDYSCTRSKRISNPTIPDTRPLSEVVKPIQGSWECPVCYVRNHGNKSICVACETPKSGGSLFDRFKPPVGSWECTGCFVRNDSDSLKCAACDAAKPDSQNAETGASKGFLFQLGLGAQAPTTFKFAGTGASPSSESTGFTVPQPQPSPGTFKFGSNDSAFKPNQQPESENFSFINNDITPVKSGPFTFGNDSNVATPPKSMFGGNAFKTTPNTFKFGGGDEKEKQPFSFGAAQPFKFSFGGVTEKSPKGSPVTSPRADNQNDSLTDSSFQEDETDHLIFQPVIPLPDKVEVRTGEEDETVLFCHKGKLFRMDQGEWKERGLGDMKVLKHNQTEKIRLLMRRSQVLKICLNHYLTSDIVFKNKDDRSMFWAAQDFSDGEVRNETFALRFKLEETTCDFKDVIAKLQGKAVTPRKVTTASPSLSPPSKPELDIEFIDEMQPTSEERQKAIDLMLPPTFYLYKRKKPCKGCRGCTDTMPGEKVETAATAVTKSPTAPSTPETTSTTTIDLTTIVPATIAPATTASSTPVLTSIPQQSTTETKLEEKESDNLLFTNSQFASLSFSALAESDTNEISPFGKPSSNAFFTGAGAPLFTTKQPSKQDTDNENDDSVDAVTDDVDPHFEPIVALPDLVEVKTGEEDEEKIYAQRAKVYRFDKLSKQWKERGVGELKILYHPTHHTYRLLLRREQVYKVALNHLLTDEIVMKPMSTSNSSFCWGAVDYSEGDGQLGMLAVHFKTAELAKCFKEKVDECLAKLQANKSQNVSGMTDSLEDDFVKVEAPLVIEKEVEGRAEMVQSPKPVELQEQVEPPKIVEQPELVEPLEKVEPQPELLDIAHDDLHDVEEDNLEEEEPDYLFIHPTTLYVLEDGQYKVLGEGLIHIQYDDDYYGSRVTMTAADDDDRLLCTHLITMHTILEVNRMSCMWTVLDFASEIPQTRSFRATFQSQDHIEDFVEVFNEGIAFARHADIEAPIEPLANGGNERSGSDTS